MVVAYDGTDFHGWQRQPHLRTAQGELEAGLATVLGETIVTTAAGRTDAGVHARGQVVSFRTGTRLPVTALVPLLRRTLPDDLGAVRAETCADDFDARRSARARHYAYRLLDRDDLLWRRYAWHPPGAIDGAALRAATETLLGEHDFTALRSTGSSPSSPTCRVMRAEWTRWDAGWRLDIVADHFLYHMVRNVVGTALAVARTADPAATMQAVIASRDRTAAGPTIPPQGLSLEEVTYTS